MTLRSAVALACVATALAAATGQAQARSVHVGPRVTYNFDFEEAAIGFQLGIPLASRLDFYPSVDVFLPDDGSLVGFNADLRFQPAPRDAGPLYLGTGLNLTRRAVRGVSNTDAGLNLLAGLEAPTGAIHPFIEARAILSDRNSVQLTGGLNIRVSSR